MKILSVMLFVVFIHSSSFAETVRSSNSSADSEVWPVDCPDCTHFKKGQKQNNTGGRLVPKEEIIEHVNALLGYFPKDFINPQVAVCIAEKESKRYSRAINGGSTARGLYQVLIGTANAALKETPCKGVMPYNWSSMAVSVRAQTFMFLCVAYMKTREAGRRSFDEVAVKRYHGNKSDSVNKAYLKSVRSKGCSGVI